MINVCCFKAVSFGVICYAAIDNQDSLLSLFCRLDFLLTHCFHGRLLCLLIITYRLSLWVPMLNFGGDDLIGLVRVRNPMLVLIPLPRNGGA